MLTIMKDALAQNIRQLYGQISDACEKYDRDADDITIVAVTKTHSVETIKMAVAAGLHNIGESRVQEAEEKIRNVGQIARFHLIGHLQSNKVKKAVGLFDVIQSVDTLKLAEEIDRQAAQIDSIIECLLEVNISGESQKFGVAPTDALDLIERINKLQRIDLTGLMTIGPMSGDEETVRAAFANCGKVFKLGHRIVGDGFDTLSMGMSGDFPLAIAEGATMIRVGSGLFGRRKASV